MNIKIRTLTVDPFHQLIEQCHEEVLLFLRCTRTKPNEHSERREAKLKR